MTLYSQQGPADSANHYTATRFLVQQILAKVQTATLVQIKGVRNAGGISAVGTVDVLPLVNQMTANRQPVQHGTIYGIPYLRIQGGTNAVILDPVVGDVGICVFASRDISSVKASKAQSNPGSGRSFDWADGLYLGGVLNGVPTQYVAFASAGITIKSPTKITIDAPTVEIKGGGTSIDGKPFLPHEHSGVTTGGGQSGPVA